MDRFDDGDLASHHSAATQRFRIKAALIPVVDGRAAILDSIKHQRLWLAGEASR